jgi:hypothetical protein
MDINSLGYGWRMRKGRNKVGHGTFQAQRENDMKLRNTLDAMECTLNELQVVANAPLDDWQERISEEVATLRRQLAALTAEFASDRPKRFRRAESRV